MRTISVPKVIPAPIDTVFDEHADHERLPDLPMAISSKVATPGRSEKNGVGAGREVDRGPLLGLTEEIVGSTGRLGWSTTTARRTSATSPRTRRSPGPLASGDGR
jgi:hypothetical protein